MELGSQPDDKPADERHTRLADEHRNLHLVQRQPCLIEVLIELRREALAGDRDLAAAGRRADSRSLGNDLLPNLLHDRFDVDFRFVRGLYTHFVQLSSPK